MIGKQLKLLRENAGLTQEGFANEVGISRASVSLYETNRREPELDIVIKLADYFDVSVDILIGRKPLEQEMHCAGFSDEKDKINAVATRIKLLRKQKNITQTKMAEDLALGGKSTISSYETGLSTPEIETLIKIAAYFNVSINYIFERTEETTPYAPFSMATISDVKAIEQLREDVGNRIKEMRKDHNLTQDELASLLNMSAKSTVSSYERGSSFPSNKVLSDLADVFQVSIDYLLCQTDIEENQKVNAEAVEDINVEVDLCKETIFGQRLKILRKLKNITQDDLAQGMNLSRATIAGYEARGKQPDFEKLIWLAKYFDVTTDYLLGLTDQMNIQDAKAVNMPSGIRMLLEDKSIFNLFCDYDEWTIKERQLLKHMLEGQKALRKSRLEK
jgi:transcriptional regulator with XRE-family HTH domain